MVRIFALLPTSGYHAHSCYIYFMIPKFNTFFMLLKSFTPLCISIFGRNLNTQTLQGDFEIIVSQYSVVLSKYRLIPADQLWILITHRKTT